MNRRARRTWLACVLPSLALAGCASAPPELTAARMETREASGGELAAVASRDVTEARNAVDEADACVERNGDLAVVRDLAYVASRRIERARVIASTNRQIDPATDR